MLEIDSELTQGTGVINESIAMTEAGRRRTVQDWEELLRNHEKQSPRLQLPVEHDDDAIPLGQAASNHWGQDQKYHALILKLFTGFTELGAHLLARGLRQCYSLHLHIVCDEAIKPHCDAIVRILYLELNRLSFGFQCQSMSDAFDLFRLEHDDRNLDLLTLQLEVTDPVVFGKLLQGNTQLKELQITDGPQVTPEGARALAVGLSKFTTFYFENTDGDLQRVLYQDGMQNSGRLFELTMKAQLEPSINWKSLLPSLKHLSIELSYSQRPLANVGLLGAALEHTSNLTRLSLAKCEIGDRGMRVLSQGLYLNKSLEFLNLRRNYIGDEGITSFAHNLPLKSLRLDCNDFGHAGLLHLMTAVVNHRAMDDLNLRSCRNFGLLGLQLTANAISRLKLSSLNLDDCFASVMHSPAFVTACQLFRDGVKDNYDMSWVTVHLGAQINREIAFYPMLNRLGAAFCSPKDMTYHPLCSVISWRSHYTGLVEGVGTLKFFTFCQSFLGFGIHSERET